MVCLRKLAHNLPVSVKVYQVGSAELSDNGMLCTR